MRKYYTLNETRFRHVIEGLFRRYAMSVDKQSFDPSRLFEFDQTRRAYLSQDSYAFFINPNARRNRRTLITLDTITPENATRELLNIVREIKPKWESVTASDRIGEMIDAIEMEKIRMGVIAALFHGHVFEIKKDLLSETLFSEAHAYLRLKESSTLSGIEFGQFAQTAICSEMKGAINKMSRKEYVERYTAQPMNTENSYHICFVHNNTKKTWHLVFSKESLSGKETVGAQKVEVKTGKAFDGIERDYKTQYARQEGLFDLATSKYQMQFLTKTYGGDDSWWSKNELRIELNSYSFIVEQPIELVWNIQGGTVSMKRKEFRLFVSIPFSIAPKRSMVRRDLKNRARYMGIDVGEYGLAWTVLDVDRKQQKANSIVSQGFLYEQLTRKIREYVQTLKSRQIKGTFGMPNTKLERLRENAVTSLRNQVHDIAMRYDAIPVYEFEISNFETGSNRVKVIYDSVKRADVGRGGSEADKAEADLVWGKQGKNFGKQIGAYATSYICAADAVSRRIKNMKTVSWIKNN